MMKPLMCFLMELLCAKYVYNTPVNFKPNKVSTFDTNHNVNLIKAGPWKSTKSIIIMFLSITLDVITLIFNNLSWRLDFCRFTLLESIIFQNLNVFSSFRTMFHQRKWLKLFKVVFSLFVILVHFNAEK